MRGYRADVAFDGDRELPGGALVLVDDGMIVGVDPPTAAAPDGCEVLHVPGTTLLPGLIDAHTHLCGDNSMRALDQLPELSPDQLDAIVTESMHQQLAAGVTAVRDLGDHQWTVVERHRGRPDGLTVVASGPPITCVRGHCANMGGEAAGVDQLRAAVRERAERGADLVKIMTSGGIMTAGTDILAAQFTLEELRAVVEEAHRQGLAVAAHAHALAAVELCVDAGVDTIEHCSCMTAKGLLTPPGLAVRMAATGIAACPTLGQDLAATGGELPPHIVAAMERVGATPERHTKQVAKLYAGGVTLISGADSGINPNKRHGLLPTAVVDLVVDCGVPATVGLASATGVAADECGLGRRTGRLHKGLDADLLLVHGDPLRDISAVGRPHTVVSRGRIVVTGSQDLTHQ
jgi:imidazolonepropionase-like amidohydrolase